METALQNEKALMADIDALRQRFPQTQDLYREVCATMFFRYGVTPTANKLYQLVRKGSMSAPAEALHRFWENLRERSRVTVTHPDLPDTLKDAAGELVATLWAGAQTAAHEALAAMRCDALAQVEDVRASEKRACAERDQSKAALSSIQNDLMQAQSALDVLRHEVTALATINSSLESQLRTAKTELAACHGNLDTARRDFAAELEKLREAARVGGERLVASEKRALLEIDRERMSAIGLEKALENARAESQARSDAHRTESRDLQMNVTELKHALGVLEGHVQAASESRAEAIIETKTLRAKLADVAADIVGLRTERDTLLRQLQEEKKQSAQPFAARSRRQRPRP